MYGKCGLDISTWHLLCDTCKHNNNEDFLICSECASTCCADGCDKCKWEPVNGEDGLEKGVGE